MSHGSSESTATVHVCRRCEAIVLDEESPECCDESMERFESTAVDEPELTTLLRHVFGVSAAGIEICVHLMDEEAATVADVASALDLNRSTASRQLNRLLELGVVQRREQALDRGGHIYLYSPVAPEEVRRQLRTALLEWVAAAVELVDDVDRRKLEAAAKREPEMETGTVAPADE